jgi:hypothetical protein
VVALGRGDMQQTAVGEWVRMQEPDFYREGIFKLVPRWDKCISVLVEYVERIIILQWNK